MHEPKHPEQARLISAGQLHNQTSRGATLVYLAIVLGVVLACVVAAMSFGLMIPR